MLNWIYVMSILGCVFVFCVVLSIAYKFVFRDKSEDGCIKYGCGVMVVFMGIYLVFFTLGSLSGLEEKRLPVVSHKEKVFICTGETSTKYHCDKDCKGLSRCSGEIEEVSEEEAEDMGRTPCRICY